MLSLLFTLLCACYFSGIIIRTKSRLSGRQGPPLLQPVYNIVVLLRKGSVYSRTSGFITRIAPIVIMASTLTASLLIPFGLYTPSALSFNDDFVLFAYLMALGRFAMIALALDSGSAFGGMGSSREALFGMLIEPAFFFIMGSLALTTGNSSFYEIISHFHSQDVNGWIIGLLFSIILFNIMLVETARVPIDDPKTHLELTMIHEAMILDISGFDLAMIQISTLIKFAIYGGLIAAVLIPLSLAPWLYILLFIGVEILCAIAVGVIESFRARYKMTRTPSYLAALVSVALIALIAAIALNSSILNL